MHRNNNNNNNHHEPPHLPPLSVSLRPTPAAATVPLFDDKPSAKPDTAISLAVEKYYSPLTSPLPATPPQQPPPPPQHRVVRFSRREEPPPPLPLPQLAAVYGGERVVSGAKKEVVVVKRVGVVVRVLEIVFCVISFSVMSTDKTQGWSGDSYDRYKEYRFCLTVAIVGFVYSTFQAYDLVSHIATGKHAITHRFRYHFAFIMDQILAYLLISASSASASRVVDWQMNWGKDEFTEKASASIGMAFMAFICFAVSSLISGYNLCNRDLY